MLGEWNMSNARIFRTCFFTDGFDSDLAESGVIDFRDFALFGQNWRR